MSDAALVTALRECLDGRWGHVRETCRRDLAGARFAAPTEPLPLEEHRALTTARLHEIAEQPFARMGFDPAVGGTGDHGGSVTAFEMLGHLDLSLFVKVGVQFGLFGGAVAGLGTQRHHDVYLPGVIDATLPGCFAMTETAGGSDVMQLRTTATYDRATDEIVIHSPDAGSRKDYIGNAARDGRMAAVFAQLVVPDGDTPQGHGVHCVLVPIRDGSRAPMPGVTIGDCGPKMGLTGVDNGTLLFDQVRVPRANLLDRHGGITDDGRYESPIESDSRRFFTMLGTLARGRVSVGGGAGAATRNALTIAVEYALGRTQFDRPGTHTPVRLIEYAVHQRRLLIPLARSYALALATGDLVAQMHDVQSVTDPSEHDVRALEERAASLKIANTAHATRTIQECREACGGAGYLWESRIGALKADTDVFTSFEGDNTVLLQLVAKGLLTHFKDSFESFDTRAMIRYGARQFAGSLIERLIGGSVVQRLLAGAPGRDADDALTDLGGQLAMFEDRERHTVEGLANRMRARSGKAEDVKDSEGEGTADDVDGPGDEADNDHLFGVLHVVQPHMLAAAWAHIDRILLDAFAAAVEESHGEVRELLGKVCDLFVLSTVESNAAWFLEHGRISAAQSKEVTRRVSALCADLALQADVLVAAFGIPEDWLTGGADDSRVRETARLAPESAP